MKKQLLYFVCLVVVATTANAQQTVGLFQNDAASYDGYTLFAPNSSTQTYLIDNCGRMVHSWSSNQNPGVSVYLLEDGTLLRTGNTNSNSFTAGGAGGMIERLDWDGQVLWSYEISDNLQRQHHDVEYLPNGNILVIVWELKTATEAMDAGRNPALIDGAVWSEKIIELEPVGTQDANIVWEWHLWDHVVQDYDANQPNYGVVADHPELVNLNFVQNTNNVQDDWVHLNSVAYNAELDQIVLSPHNFHELWIIDHNTTTAEAAGSAGDILYRWGNPQTYDRGTAADRQLFGQHDARWIDAGQPGEGEIMIYNNGIGRPAGNYSTVDVIAPPEINGTYTLMAGQSYGPAQPSWQYEAPVPEDFYSSNISGAHRLANGNTVICQGASGRFFEVDSNGTIVWEYVNPVTRTGPVSQGTAVGTGPNSNSVFRCTRYAPDYAGLMGKDLTPGNPIELNPTANACETTTGIGGLTLAETELLTFYPNPSDGLVAFDWTETTPNEELTLAVYSMTGKQVAQIQLTPDAGPQYLWDLTWVNPGTYTLQIASDGQRQVQPLVLIGEK